MKRWTKPNKMSAKTSIKLKNLIRSGKLKVSDFELENLTGGELSSILKSRISELGISIHLWTITSHIDTIKSLLRDSNPKKVSEVIKEKGVSQNDSIDFGIDLIKSKMADGVIKEIQIHYVSGRVEKFTKLQEELPKGKPLFIKESGKVIIDSGQYRGFYIKDNTVWTSSGKKVLDIFTGQDWVTFYAWVKNAQDSEYINSISRYRDRDILERDLTYLQTLTKWIEKTRGYGRR